MQRSNLLLLVVVLLGIALMTVWRMFADEIPAPGSADPAGQSVAGSGAAADPTQPGPEVELPASAPRVVVDVVEGERYRPLPAQRVQAVQLPARTPLPTHVLAGSGASPWTHPDEMLKSGLLLVEVAREGGRLVRVVSVDAAGSRELGFGTALQVRGTVADERGNGIAGARVWLGDLLPDGSARELTTDSDGAFETDVCSSSGVPLVVRADGFVWSWLSLTVDVDARRDVRLVMRPGGEVEVQSIGQAENITAGRVLVSPTARRSAELSRYPFFWQHLFGGVPLDSRGRALLPGLPRRGGLNVTVAHPQVPLGVHRELTLDGERTTCSVQVATERAWSGRVVDERGEAIGGAALLLRPGGRRVFSGSNLLMQPPQLAARGCLFTTSRDDGTFTLGVVRAPGSVLSVRAPGFAGREIPIAASAPEVVTLPAWQGGEPVLRIKPPAAGVAWQASIGLGTGVEVACGPDQDAVVALPYVGSFAFRLATFVGEERRGEQAMTISP